MRSSIRSRLLVTTLVLLTPVSALADRVDEKVLSLLSERHIPGAAVAVVRNGRVVKIKGYGSASLEFNVPVTSDTVFEIGSVSKQMTAAGIMLLVEDGKVGLDEKISRYLPGTPDAWRDVTVRHLLTHTSGIKSYSSLDGFALLKRLKVDGFIKLLAPYPLEFPVGDRNIYSNSGFTLLAYIIESASGMSYMDFVQTRIFRPLGMTKTTDRDPQFIVKNRAVGYEWNGTRYEGRNWDLTDLKGAGSIISTIGDLVKWNAALSGTAFLKPSSKAEMWKQFTFNNGKLSPYGFGWRISNIRGHKLIGHTGQTSGFGAANFRYVDDKVTVAVLTNQGESGMGSLIAAAVAKIYIPSMSLRAMPSVIDTDREHSDTFMKALMSRLANRPDAAVMTPQLVQNISSQRAKTANSRISTFGPTRTLSLVGEEEVDGKSYRLYRTDTGKRLFLWRVAFDRDGRVAEMTLDEEE